MQFRSRVAFLTTAFVLLFASLMLDAAAQSPGSSGGNGTFTEAWVDPYYGIDASAAINDPTNPFRTLNEAIKQVRLYLEAQYPNNNDMRGIVYAQPGVYGPVIDVHIPSSGDVLPIKMVDRVHVQGVNARACIIRGGGSSVRKIFWPDHFDVDLVSNGQNPCTGCGTGSSCYPTYPEGVHFNKEVLVDFTYAHPHAKPYGNLPPWSSQSDTPEMLDGFTFEGGDVQVLVANEWDSSGGKTPLITELNATVSNCVFDMRDGWAVPFHNGTGSKTVSGPTFGMMFAPVYRNPGYHEQYVLVANNSFIQAEYTDDGWVTARFESIAVFNVSDTGFQNCTGTYRDPNANPIGTAFKGVVDPFLLNNLFRTPPATYSCFACVGFGERDAEVCTNPPTCSIASLLPTNAFCPALVGSSTGGSPPTWASVPIRTLSAGSDTDGTIVNYGTNPLAELSPNPAVAIWDGSASPPQQEYDPGFVGEYVALGALTPVAGYRDWRLLPDSPLRDMGYYSASGVSTGNGWTWIESAYKKVKIFDEDGEYYGNPRIVGGVPDIGADEVHLVAMAGSYSNDSISHNTADSVMDPGVPSAPALRYLIVPDSIGGHVPTLTQVDGALLAFAIPTGQNAPTAWAQPFATLTTPVIHAGLPSDFDTTYINTQNRPTSPTNPGGWNVPSDIAQVAQITWTHPMGVPNQSHVFRVTTKSDSDTPSGQVPGAGYFNTQLEMQVNGVDYWSNLQTEYR